MSQPEQIDLIEYLAGDARKAEPRPLTLPRTAIAEKASVQYEHMPSPHQAERLSACVQSEHAQPASSIEGRRAGAEADAGPAPMSSHRLLVCLAVLGWSERELARRTGRLQTTVRRWITRSSPVPADVATWLELLAAYHRAHPAPRAGQGLAE